MPFDHTIIKTKSWINSFIITYNICPFARLPFVKDKINYVQVNSTSIEDSLHTLIRECHLLDKTKAIETSFIIFPNNFSEFNDFLDFVSLSEELLSLQNYDGIFQLASFHPMYCFDNALNSDPENFTNRSPYPMLHIIRESSISLATEHFPNINDIPKNNITLLRDLGINKLKQILR